MICIFWNVTLWTRRQWNKAFKDQDKEISTLESHSQPLLWNAYEHWKTHKTLKCTSHAPVLRKKVTEEKLYPENGESNPEERNPWDGTERVLRMTASPSTLQEDWSRKWILLDISFSLSFPLHIQFTRKSACDTSESIQSLTIFHFSCEHPDPSHRPDHCGLLTGPSLSFLVLFFTEQLAWCDPFQVPWIRVICCDVDGPRVCHIEWSKSEREKQISYIHTYTWNQKNGTDEPVCRAGAETQM